MALEVKRPEYRTRSGFEELFGTGQQCLCWDDDARICWNDNIFCWEDVCLVLKVVGSGPTFLPYEIEQNYQKLNEKDKKKFISLILEIKGEKDIFKEKREIKNMKVTVKDIKLVAKAILNIEVEVLR